MSFDALTPDIRPTKEQLPECRVSVFRPGRLPSRLVVLLRRRVIDEHFPRATRCFVDLGVAEDAHLLRLRFHEDGPFVLGETGISRKSQLPGQTVRIFLSHHKRWPTVAIPAVEARFKVKGNAMEITLPSWAWEAGAKVAIERRAAASARAAA